MKFSTASVFFALASGAAAFVPQQTSKSTSVKVESSKQDEEMSQALPFQRRPHTLDGSLAGDVGFE